MKRLLFALVAAGMVLLPGTVGADDATFQANARLNGFQEVVPKLTDGTGTFSATVTGTSLTYKLTYSSLSGPAFMAHIHFAQPGVNGGIFIWLCGSAMAPGPAGTPTCPAAGVTVTRTVTAADVVAINTPGAADQGVDAGNFAGALRILRSGDAYANVHTPRYPGGEIRGAIRIGED